MSGAQEGTENLAGKEHSAPWNSFEEHVGSIEEVTYGRAFAYKDSVRER